MLQTVTTKYGAVQGVVSEGHVVFKGVPYAAPPVGERRWKAPEEPSSWEGIRICDHWGPACIQVRNWGSPRDGYGREFYAGPDYPPLMSEDCLYLNIWTPAQSADEKLPVMMWMHGGGVQSGYSHEIPFDGKEICKRGVILVTINYRLNVFGYFAHPDLTAESKHHASGNYGLLDQIQALRWIHDNIAAFGGDPDRVTAFGQSGGGRSTQALSCSPLTKGLLHRAIVHSAGGISTAAGRLPRELMEQRGAELVEYCGCNSLAELRAMQAEQLHGLFQKWGMDFGGGAGNLRRGFNISTDGYALPLSMEDTILQGKQNDLDYILGSVSGDAHMGPMMASLRGWSRMQCESGLKPSFTYYFDRELPEDDTVDPHEMIRGAFHSAELWYVFGTLERCWRPFTAEDYELSRIMIDYWTNFAKTGDPNGEGLPEWTRYTPTNKLHMRLNTDAIGMTDLDPDGTVQQQEDELFAKLREGSPIQYS